MTIMFNDFGLILRSQKNFRCPHVKDSKNRMDGVGYLFSLKAKVFPMCSCLGRLLYSYYRRVLFCLFVCCVCFVLLLLLLVLVLFCFLSVCLIV